MDFVSANRIVSLQRQIDALRASVKRGALMSEEADCLIQPKKAEIDRIRGQSSLKLEDKKSK